MSVVILLEGGPWHMERRRFPEPPPTVIFVAAGGEYRLEGSMGRTFRFYPERSAPPEPRRAI